MNEEQVIQTIADNSEEIKDVAVDAVNNVITNGNMFWTGALAGSITTVIGGCIIYLATGHKIKPVHIFKKKAKDDHEVEDDTDVESEESESEAPVEEK